MVEQAGCGEETEADRCAGGVVVEHAVSVSLDAEQQAQQRLRLLPVARRRRR